jgi:hypothetical protein
VLSLSRAASLAAYETELDSITYASANATTSRRTILWSVNDGINASAPVTSHVSVSPDPSAPAPDLNILMRNTRSGQVSVWEMDSKTIVGGGPVANPGPSSKAIGTGDFNNDGKSDILMQNTSTGAAVANPGTSWHAIGTGAGGSDILLQNISGQTSIWEMDGATKIGGGPLTPNAGPSWHAIGLT